MSWNVGIPSYRRADIISGRTLRVLAEGGVPRERVFLSVTPDEIAEYKAKVDPGLFGAFIQTAVPGDVASSHNAINAALGPGRVVHMDDDVRAVMRRVSDKELEKVEDICQLFDVGFDAAERRHASLWGVYPVANPYFMGPSVTTRLCLIIGWLFGQVIEGRAHEQTSLRVKNDYERSLMHFMADGAVARLDWITCNTQVYKGEGGLIGVRTPENAQLAVDELMRRFPGLVAMKKAKSEWPEIRLVAPRA